MDVKRLIVLMVWLMAVPVPVAAQWEGEIEAEVRINAEEVDEAVGNVTVLREIHLFGHLVRVGGGGGYWWTGEESSEGRVWPQMAVSFGRLQLRSRMEIRFEHDDRWRNRLRYLQRLGPRWALQVSEEAVGYRQWRTQAGARWYLGAHYLDTLYMARYRPAGRGWDHLAVIKLIVRDLPFVHGDWHHGSG